MVSGGRHEIDLLRNAGTPPATEAEVYESSDSELPVLPYDGTSGHSGSETSEERARREDSDGTTKDRQAQVIAYLKAQGWYGATWKEVADAMGIHHGAASGALSVLHKEGLVCRLQTTRMGSKVYVLPTKVDGRVVESQGRNDPRVLTEREREVYDLIRRVADQGVTTLRADHLWTLLAYIERVKR